MPEERKLVTILFADVTGSTALGESLDPEDVRALMSRYYDHAREVVALHGGTLEKFIGDAVMAVFGLPQAHGDDAERAAAAALALRDAIAGDELLGDRFALRIGLNTGEVIGAQDTRSADFLVTGDAVNVAARLQQHAEPGYIVAGERTASSIQFAFELGEAFDVEARGKSQPVRAYPVLGARGTRQIARPPLVGRKQDLMQLSLLLSRALEERQPQLVSIVAPAGTGKTRLLEEFLVRIDPADGFTTATARCLPYGQTLSYWPLRGLLEAVLDGEVSKERVHDAFVSGGQRSEEAARLADLVLATLGVDSDEMAERDAIFNAWRLLIEALAQTQPRIVVFEDLHWASDSLLDLVEHVMHPRSRAPLLLIALSRPELLDRRPTWGGGRQSFTALALNPLTEQQTQDLVDQLGGGLPAGIRDRIVERSGGNPFFAAELVRGLAERGITGNARPDDLPDTVYSAVLARLDLLSPDARSALQVAAVAGRAFRPAIVEAVAGSLTSQQIEAAFEELLARDLITQAEGGGFTFRHILIRDVAYGMLSRSERIRIHAGIAGWLEEMARNRLDEYTELIAYHYREAVTLSRQSAVPLSTPVDPERAVYFLERAGELADRAGAFVEAAAHLQSAIEISPEEEHARLYERKGDVHSFGDLGIASYREALDRWRASERPNPLAGARLLRKLLMIYMRWAGSISARLEAEDLIAMRNEARTLAERAGDEDEMWRVRTADLFWPFWLGESDPENARQGMDVALAAADHFERIGDWSHFHAALDAFGALAAFAGETEARIRQYERRLAAPMPTSMDAGDSVNMLSQGYFDAGRYADSLQTVRATLAAMQSGQHVAHLGGGLSFAALAALVSGCWDDLDWIGTAQFQAWNELQLDAGAKFTRPGFAALLHRAMARDDRAAADAAAAPLDRLTRDVRYSVDHALLVAYREDTPVPLLEEMPVAAGRPDSRPGYLWYLAVMFLHERGYPAPAEVAGMYRRGTGRWMVDLMDCVIAVDDALTSTHTSALENAIQRAEATGLVPYAARMRIVLAQRTGDRGQLERARPTLQRLQDRQCLRRLEEVEVQLAGADASV